MPPTTTTTNASPMVVGIQREVRRLARQLQGAPQAGQHRAQGEYRGEEPGLVDAQRADHLAVLGGGTDQRAPAAAVQQQPQQAQHHRADGDQQQVVAWKGARPGSAPRRPCRAPSDPAGPRDPRSTVPRPHISTTCEGGEQLEQLGRVVGTRAAPAARWRAQHADQHRRDEHRRPRTPRRPEPVHQGPGHIQAHHVERAMREIDDPGDAEDQRQPCRDEKQRRGRRQPVEQLDRPPSGLGMAWHAAARPGAPGAWFRMATAISAGRSLRTSASEGITGAVDVAEILHDALAPDIDRVRPRRRPSSTGCRWRGS
jgi:hypothetical protein